MSKMHYVTDTGETLCQPGRNTWKRREGQGLYGVGCLNCLRKMSKLGLKLTPLEQDKLDRFERTLTAH